MHDTSVIFGESSWWICAGFIVLLGIITFLAFRAWKIRASVQSVILLAVVIGGIWLLGLYADKAFNAFTRFERKDSSITFYYYFGRTREFQWQDVQSITRETSSKNSSRIRFTMRNGAQLKSYDTDDESVLGDALALKKDISVGLTPPNTALEPTATAP